MLVSYEKRAYCKSDKGDSSQGCSDSPGYPLWVRGKGNYTEESDIDIAVVVDRLSDDYFEDTPLLWKLKRKISNLIEPVLLTEDQNNPLYADILKTGILV